MLLTTTYVQRQLHLLKDLARMVIWGATVVHWISQTDYLNTVRPLMLSLDLAGAHQPLERNLQMYFAALAADPNVGREYLPHSSAVYARPVYPNTSMHSSGTCTSMLCTYTCISSSNSSAELANDARLLQSSVD